MVQRKFWFSLVLLLSLGLLLWGSGQAPARSAAGESEVDLLWRRHGVPYLESEITTIADAPPFLPATFANPWSKIAFQGFRNYADWNIYKGNDDGTGQVRLTGGAESDIHARFKRGATAIVYASSLGGDYEIMKMDSAGGNKAALTNNSFDDVNPVWSPNGNRIAFQSYRDGQSEIYVMNPDGSGQTRLTNHGDWDGDPAWSPDSSKILFSSRRTGGYRIWVMNADGTGLTQLSGQPYSFNPAWSPDGTKIAFDSDADGDTWYELWVMNADGSGAYELLEAGNGKDAWARSWSPDGRYLAFTRISFIQQGGQWYWTEAYLDAWDFTLNTAVRLSNNGLDWKPDWVTTDITPPATGVNPLPAVSPGPVPVSWWFVNTGFEAPFLNYDIQVSTSPTGPWTDWHMATTESGSDWAGQGGTTYYFRSRGRDRHFNLEAWPGSPDATTTIEAIPPITMMAPLPPFLPTQAHLHWWGYDPGGSGITGYDLQYRRNGGVWSTWLLDKQHTDDIFVGLNGSQYDFRLRATDAAFNEEPFPAINTQTSFYAWAMRGTVYNNAHAPIADANVTTTPNYMAGFPSNSQGNYAVYVGNTAALYTAAWDKPGYGPLPATQSTRAGTHTFAAVLPPVDNVVLDWDFESGALAPDWNAIGSVMPQATTAEKHTGDWSAQLGEPELREQLNLFNTFTEESDLLFVPGIENDIHAVWRNVSGTVIYVYYAHRDATGVWSTPENISQGTPGQANHNMPTLFVDDQGYAHVAYSGRQNDGSREIFYIRQLPGGSWSIPENASQTINSSTYPTLAVTHWGQAHIIWIENYSNKYFYYVASRLPDGTWEIVNLSQDDSLTEASQIAVDSAGNLHVIYKQDLVYYSFRDAAGNWDEPVNVFANLSHPEISPESAQGFYESVEMKIDQFNRVHLSKSWSSNYLIRGRDGDWSTPFNYGGSTLTSHSLLLDSYANPHLLYLKDSGLYYRSQSTDGSWTGEQLLLAGADFWNVVADISEQDVIHVAVTDNSSGNWEILYLVQESGGWSTPLNISNNSGESNLPTLVVDKQGQPHIGWEDYTTGAGDIYYYGQAKSAITGFYRLTQSISIPFNTTSPVLSFLYHLYGTGTSGDTRLVAKIEDGTGVTEVAAVDTESYDWQHLTADLSPWLGQTVTLWIELEQEPGDLSAWAYIDEVSIGSTEPDVWVSMADTVPTLPGNEVAFSLWYGNQGGALADNTVLTYTWPAEIPLIAAMPAPITWTATTAVWDMGSLAAHAPETAIVLTATVAPTATTFITAVHTVHIQTSTPELEQLNNVAQAVTFVGMRSYLPIGIRE